MADSPLHGIRVLELAGLAPAPYTGLLLADYGASVLRVDRPQKSASNRPTADLLTRRKASVIIDLKDPRGRDVLLALISHVDVLIDPFRPGILEEIGLSPKRVLQSVNPRLITARLTGFRRDGKYASMAGHDINYLAVSGVLSLLGRNGQTPYPPANLLADFAGGGLMCFAAILLALFTRSRTGRGQVVESNMVDGAGHLATFARLGKQTPGLWDQDRGQNLLDGGAPFYDTYETKDGKFVAVGALEPQFFAALLKGLGISEEESVMRNRMDRSTWPKIRRRFAKGFSSRTRKEWESIFDGTDACVTPVLEYSGMEEDDYQQRPAATLTESPGLPLDRAGVEKPGLTPGAGGETILRQWLGWEQSRDYAVENGSFVRIGKPKL